MSKKLSKTYGIGFISEGEIDLYDKGTYTKIKDAQDSLLEILEDCSGDELEGWFVFSITPVFEAVVTPPDRAIKVKWVNSGSL